MADTEDNKAETSAEKAYAAAAEAVVDKEVPQTEVAAVAVDPVEFPAKPKRGRKAREEVTAAPPPEKSQQEKSQAEESPAEKSPKATPPAAAKRIKAPVAKATRAASKPAPKPVVKRAAAKITPKAPVRKIKQAPTRAPAAAKLPTAAKTTAAAKPGTSAPHFPFIAQLKDIPMDVTSSIKDAVSGAQAKAKEAFDKTSAAASEYGEFAKGNVEAFVESGKILASGLQELGNGFIADSKVAFDTATSDVKALTSVKSPTDLFKLQTELLRRNFDSAIAYGTKASEAMVKLTNEVVAPLSGRVTLAVEKVKKAA
jgi:phasin family protein